MMNFVSLAESGERDLPKYRVGVQFSQDSGSSELCKVLGPLLARDVFHDILLIHTKITFKHY